MEIFELRYFLGVAKRQNLHRAADDMHVSPASLSKAVARLEDELGVALFTREGRNIKLTDYGKVLMRRAAEILGLEESARLELQAGKGPVHAVITGPEVLLLGMSRIVESEIQARFPLASFELTAASEARALEMAQSGEAHLAIVASDAPKGLAMRVLGESSFQTCVGAGHPLAKRAKKGKSAGAVPIAELLEHGFVCPSLPLFGQVGQHQSEDGWRDDQFPRRVAYVSTSLAMIEQVVVQGRAVAYLPDYHVRKLKLTPLVVRGCPYFCKQTIKLVARDPKRLGWLSWLFD